MYWGRRGMKWGQPFAQVASQAGGTVGWLGDVLAVDGLPLTETVTSTNVTIGFDESADVAITGDWDFSGGTLRLPQGTTDPTSGMQEGDIFWDTDDDELNVYNGSSWTAIAGGGGGVAGSDTEIQFNSSGSHGASSSLTWSSGTLSVSGTIALTGNQTLTTAAQGGTPGLGGSLISSSSVQFDDTNTLASGTAAAHAFIGIGIPDLTATNINVTTTDAANLYIAGAPTAGTNQTITNSWALWIDDGGLRVDNTLSAATGDEVAFQFNYNTNKATSGNDTGLVINQTDTLSPGTSLLLDAQVGGSTKVSIDNAGKLTTIPGTFESGVTATGTATAYIFDTTNTLIAGDKHTVWRNATTDLMTLDKDGQLGINGVPSGAGLDINRASGAHGLYVGGTEDFVNSFIYVNSAISSNLMKLGSGNGLLAVANSTVTLGSAEQSGYTIDGNPVHVRAVTHSNSRVSFGIWRGASSTVPYMAVTSTPWANNGSADIFVIDADGDIGIGDSDPGTLLQLKGANAYLTLQNSTAENTDGGAETRIIFEDHANAALAQIQGSHDGTADDTKGDLIFYTHSGSALTERMRLDSAAVLTMTGNIVPEADGTRDLGVQTTGQWANVWSDLINGADIMMANKWRMVESEVYSDYPQGWAIGHNDAWKDGVSLWKNRGMIGDKKPVFVVTDDFIEYKGRRITGEMLDKLIVMAA